MSVYLEEFNSLEQLAKYLQDTPTNTSFDGTRELASITGRSAFTGTNSLKEALTLMKYGDDDLSKNLTQRISAVKFNCNDGQTRKLVNDICGFQVNVANYLIGVPNNMLNQKIVQKRTKIVTIDKCITYNSFIGKQQIIDEGVKVLALVKKLEQQGVRVNLNVIFAAKAGRTEIIARVKIKSSSERLHIGKTAFALTNPSMLRRILFRFLEVYPNTTEMFTDDYGKPIPNYRIVELLKKHKKQTTIISPFLGVSVDEITKLDDTQNFLKTFYKNA